MADKRWISVSATGEASVAPDLAIVSFAVSGDGKELGTDPRRGERAGVRRAGPAPRAGSPMATSTPPTSASSRSTTTARASGSSATGWSDG